MDRIERALTYGDSDNITKVGLGPGEGGSGDSRRAEAGRAHKKPRLVWTAELHARFMNAVNHLVRGHSFQVWHGLHEALGRQC